MRMFGALLEALGDEGPDLIIGGHEHDKLSRQVGDRWVLKADADARTATVAKVTLVGSGPPEVSFRWVDLEGDRFPQDPRVRERVKDWLGWFDEGFCTNLEPPERLGCVDLPLGRAGVELIAEELEIRQWLLAADRRLRVPSRSRERDRGPSDPAHPRRAATNRCR